MTTPAERKEAVNKRKQKERGRDKELGLIRRDVKAHPDDWEEIRELEARLRSERGI